MTTQEHEMIRTLCKGGKHTVKSIESKFGTYTFSQAVSRYRKRYPDLRVCLHKQKVPHESYYQYWIEPSEIPAVLDDDFPFKNEFNNLRPKGEQMCLL